MTRENSIQVIDPQLAQVVDTLLARHRWRLLTRDEYIRRLAVHVASGLFRDIPTAAFNLYTLELHAACAGNFGADRQELAYLELGRFLGDVAHRRYGRHGVELVDETLSDIFERFASCRKPGAFLAFAIQRLRNRVKQSWASPEVNIDDHDDQLPYQLDLELDAVMAAELRARLVACRELFLRRYKRAHLQFDAVWMKYMLHLDDTTIGARLGKAPQQVHVLRCRGLEKLRRDPDWRALAIDLGLLAV